MSKISKYINSKRNSATYSKPEGINFIFNEEVVTDEFDELLYKTSVEIFSAVRVSRQAPQSELDIVKQRSSELIVDFIFGEFSHYFNDIQEIVDELRFSRYDPVTEAKLHKQLVDLFHDFRTQMYSIEQPHHMEK